MRALICLVLLLFSCYFFSNEEKVAIELVSEVAKHLEAGNYEEIASLYQLPPQYSDQERAKEREGLAGTLRAFENEYGRIRISSSGSLPEGCVGVMSEAATPDYWASAGRGSFVTEHAASSVKEEAMGVAIRLEKVVDEYRLRSIFMCTTGPDAEAKADRIIETRTGA